MSTRANRNGTESVPAPGEFESLYLSLVKLFYEKDDRKRTEKIASRLEKVLAASPDYSASIRGEEVRSLIAEFRGDFAEAAWSREAEIRKILELHALTANTENWKYVSRQYDFSDVGDRLDLLAMLYDTQGKVDRAISTLLESKHYCQSHRISFDAQDMLEELRQARAEATDRTQALSLSARELIDKQIREVYRGFGASADEIVVDDEMSRRFTEAVKQVLSGKAAVTVKEVKKRLLSLRRRGEARGGLPRRKG